MSYDSKKKKYILNEGCGQFEKMGWGDEGLGVIGVFHAVVQVILNGVMGNSLDLGPVEKTKMPGGGWMIR